jgi:hypothetical protein
MSASLRFGFSSLPEALFLSFYPRPTARGEGEAKRGCVVGGSRSHSDRAPSPSNPRHASHDVRRSQLRHALLCRRVPPVAAQVRAPPSASDRARDVADAFDARVG